MPLGVTHYAGNCAVCAHQEREITAKLLSGVYKDSILDEYLELLPRNINMHAAQCLPSREDHKVAA